MPKAAAPVETNVATANGGILLVACNNNPAPQINASYNTANNRITTSGGAQVDGNTPAGTDSFVVFASNVGGGLESESHFSLRLVEADYLVTLFHNEHNDHQNILRLSTGVVLYFGRH